MMTLLFSPVRHDTALNLSRTGDSLVVNGTEVDFSGLETGARLTAGQTGSDWILGAVRDTHGMLQVTVLLPHGPRAENAHRFPAAMTLDGDGPVALPG